MFSGIVEEPAVVTGLRKEEENLHITMRCSFTNELKIDQSVAHNGVCLTVVDIKGDEYTVTAMQETLLRSNIGVLQVGDKVNAVASGSQYYLCPIIKMEPDSPETEYTEDELPALTIFLKKDTQVDHEWFPKKQKHDVTAAKYYGVALTNAAKVVLAKFKK